jgi:acyl dehydratase
MSGWYLEDLTIGRRIETDPVTLDAEEIETAKDTIFKGLIASGFQTVAVATGQFIRTGIIDGNGLGGPGLDKIRWVAPVRPGDTLSTVIDVVEARVSKSDSSRGVVRLAFVVSNAAGIVATFETIIMIRARG